MQVLSKQRGDDFLTQKNLFIKCLMVWIFLGVITHNASSQALNIEQVIPLLDQAYIELENDNFTRAMEIVNSAILRGMDNRYLEAEAYFIRSNVYLDIWQLDRALNDILHTMSIFSDFAPFHELLSIIYSRMGRYFDALQAINRAIALDSLKLNFFINRADVYRSLGEYERALNDLYFVLGIEPQNAFALSGKASVCLRMGNYDEALSFINQALVITTDRNFFRNRGAIHDYMGNYDAALADYSMAIELNIQHPGVFRRRGLILKRMGRNQEAANDFTAALRITPNDPRLFRYRSEAHLDMHNFAEAMSDIVEYARLTGDEELLAEIQEEWSLLLPDVELYNQLRQLVELLNAIRGE